MWSEKIARQPDVGARQRRPDEEEQQEQKAEAGFHVKFPWCSLCPLWFGRSFPVFDQPLAEVFLPTWQVESTTKGTKDTKGSAHRSVGCRL